MEFKILKLLHERSDIVFNLLREAYTFKSCMMYGVLLCILLMIYYSRMTFTVFYNIYNRYFHDYLQADINLATNYLPFQLL